MPESYQFIYPDQEYLYKGGERSEGEMRWRVSEGMSQCKEMRENCENVHSHQLKGRGVSKIEVLSIVLGVEPFELG